MTTEFYTALTTGFTALLVGATFGLWWATRKLVIGTENTARRQLRAYVMVPQVEIRMTTLPGGIMQNVVYISVKNFGQTPARSCKYWLALEVFELPLPTDFKRSQSAQEKSAGVIAPDVVFTILAKLPLLPNGSAVQSGHAAFCVYGQFHYDDIFGKRQTTDFCFTRKGTHWLDNGEMELCGNGNDAT